MAGWRLTGMTTEWMSRLPYAWASILGVAAVFLYLQRSGHPHSGGIAACLLAIEGFLVGLGRGMRHHSLVFVLTTLGLLCLLSYYRRGSGMMVIVASVLFAGAAHAHYDAILVLPVGLLLAGARLWLDRKRIWRAAAPAVAAGLIGAALTALFYLPFWRSPYVGGTSHYLSQRIGGHVYNNLWSSFELSAVYNSVYLLGVLALALAGQTLNTWRRWGVVGLIVCALLLAAMVIGLVWPERLVVEDLSRAWVPCAILLLGALFAPRQSMETRVLWLWIGVPAVFFLFFVALPLTHVYAIFPPWAMIGALGLENLGCWLSKRAKVIRYGAVAGGAAIYALCAIYPVILFVDYTPEYLRGFPQTQSPLYWTPYDQKPTEVGLYGFPYRVGWKVVGYLIDEGQLSGSYTSNEKARATGYYTRQSPRLDCASPDLYIVAADVHDQVPLRWDQIEAEYRPSIVVTVRGQPRLTVYQHNAIDPPTSYQAEEYERAFDLRTTPDRVAESALSGLTTTPIEEFIPQDVLIGDFAYLLGFKIDDTHATPGGYVELTLLWQSLKPTQVDYHVFTHLHDGERMRGQLDGQPVCGSLPTSDWQPGQIVIDPYRIPIMADAPTGTVPLVIGMYDFATMQRLPVSAPDGTPAGDTVPLIDLEIQTP
jgi:hypothetical protein